VFILLLGAPGSGKGTQGKLLAERLGLPKITTGDILRAAVKAETALGREAKKYMDAGSLVPDSVILSMIKEELAKPEAQQGAVLDGFPRTAVQAELVDRTLGERGQRLNHILLLDVPEEELVRRMTGRAAHEGRSDDTPEAIRTRLQVYQRDTAPLIAHYAERGIVKRVPGVGGVDEIKSPREIETMASAGRIVAATLALVARHVRPGISTEELDRLAEQFIRSHPGARPSFKGLYDFPATLCTSINQEVVHGIPSSKRVLKAGDLLSVDVGVWVDGLHADSAATFPVGAVSADAERLLATTRTALAAGVAQARAGNHVGDIGHAVQQVAEGAGYSVVRELVGHGIGSSFHEDPQVPNYGKPRRGPRLVPGMTIAIEPMVNVGGADIRTLDDKWTVVTEDGSLSAHFEHTVAIVENGGPPRVLTTAD